ncbi:MAG: PEP-CTERM system histidine kinase PrsK [Candidatus Rokuibacteriota bacterium]|nr:MAG: PEP-CTERM system histidine kinase PrsK [Candidatus Rokubacteria bacterium]
MMLSLWLQTLLLPAAAASSIVLAIAALVRGRGRLELAFVAGQVALAAESLIAFSLLQTEMPGDRLFWLELQQVAALIVPLPWVLFVAALVTQRPTRWLWRLVSIAVAVAATAAAFTQVLSPAFQVADVEASFYAARLGTPALAGIIMQLLATVGVLVGLEAYLRASTRESLWRSKYLVLGLATIFLSRFYFLSQALLFQVLFAAHLTASAAILLAGNIAIAASIVRARLRDGELAISRRLLYRSVVIGVLGVYLFGLGALGWLLTWLDVPEKVFWGSLIVFVSALGLVAVLMSEDIRWRARRFITLHFYRGKYDYREQWMAFTKQMGSLLSVEELSRQLLATVTTAVGAAKGALYVTDPRDNKLRLAGAIELTPEAILDGAIVQDLARQRRPVLLDPYRDALPQPALHPIPRGTVAVPLPWQCALAGIMLIGPERTRRAYTIEDLEFLTTVGEQAAGAIMTARLSEAAARSREFEAFHRLTSFVIHDLKNSISALSMLSQNALEHFDDPEFQRDAIKTLSSTVDRMKALLARLTSAPESSDLRFQSVDLAGLALEVTRHIAGNRVTLVKDLAAVRPVQGDPDAILRVMQNLVTNATEALEPGGGMLTVRTSEENGWAVLSVGDTGPGMSDHFIRTSLFAPFRSTKRGGWGIGLYQAKYLVEAHGGRVEVSSKEGDGTTFVVKLPLTRIANP